MMFKKLIHSASGVICLILVIAVLHFNSLFVLIVGRSISETLELEPTTITNASLSECLVCKRESRVVPTVSSVPSQNQCWKHTNLSTILSEIKREEICYEWMHYADFKHYADVHLSFSDSLSSQFYCDVASISVRRTCLASDSYTLYDIVSYDSKQQPCVTGGASFKFYIQSTIGDEHRYIEGNVIDLFNEKYVGVIYTGTHTASDRVSFELVIQLDFNRFQGTFNCFVQDAGGGYRKVSVQRIELHVLFRSQLRVCPQLQGSGNLSTDMHSLAQELNHVLRSQYDIDNTNFTYFAQKTSFLGHWQRRNKKYEYMLSSANQSYALNLNAPNIQQQLSRTLLLSEHMRTKWIHLLGHSRMYHFMSAWIGILRRANFKVVSYVHPQHYNFDFGEVHYLPKMQLLITWRGHDFDTRQTQIGGEWFRASWNASNYFSFVLQQFNHLDVSEQIKQFYNLRRIPNILVLNKGIHSMHKMVDRKGLLDYKYEINAYIYYFIEYWKQLKSMANNQNDSYFDALHIFWKRTTNTQFTQTNVRNHKLSLRKWTWSCRTHQRTNCINRLADSIVDKYTYPNCEEDDGVNVNMLDEYSMSLGRDDCAPDNRHYSKGNCRETFVYYMMHQMLVAFGMPLQLQN